MADVTYRIIIDGKGAKGSGKAKEKTIPVSEDTKGTQATATDIDGLYDDTDSIVKKAGKPVLASAMMLADTFITADINRVNVLTGHSELQNQINYKYGLAKRMIGVAGGLVASIATGNPLGAIAGVTMLGMRAIQIANAQTDININRSVENIGLEQIKIRAGAGGNRNAEKY